MYEEKRESSNSEMVSFDDFLCRISDDTFENEGNLNDAIFIANDAFDKL